MTHPFQNIWGEPLIHTTAKIAAFVDIGDGVLIGKDSKIQCFVSIPPGVHIGNDVFVGPGTVFCNDKNPKAKGKWTKGHIQVLDGASIGANCTILPNVTIGRNSRIGAGSVVTKDVPPGEVWVGNPAAKLKDDV